MDDKLKVFLVAGARPNFMKIAPIFRESLKFSSIECKIIHTGQHYDPEMSFVFFEELAIPEPSYHLDAAPGSHAAQTAKIMTSFEEICEKEKPDIVMVVGDVNSTLACSIVAKKLCIKLAHVEAGLRSFDMTMPEEINRMVTDAISDYFFVTEESGVKNLKNEGKPNNKICYVGHVMIDNLFYQINKLNSSAKVYPELQRIKNRNSKYAFLTLHRPSNVDSKKIFEKIALALNELSVDREIIFPVHPRTSKMIEKLNIKLSERIILLPPLSFQRALYLWKDAEVVLTDSGGLQEETTALQKPCVTVRNNTERPVTVEIGSNVLSGTITRNIIKSYYESIQKAKKAKIPKKWDGRASERIWKIIQQTERC